MEYHIRGSPFKDQFVIPSTPTPNIPTCLTSTGLQALPYISLLVGVDDLIPTKAVYALYDGSIACLRFVHGDGLFINAERVCFRNTFKDGVLNLNRSQRLHFIELMNRSMKYYHLITQNEEFKATVAREFPTASSVKATLTFMCDLKQSSCPALTEFLPQKARIFEEELPDQAMPCIPLTAGPIWDFSSKGFQAFATHEMDLEFTRLYRDYCNKYCTKILPIDFQHALFCLAGLMEANLIPFVSEGQNNPKFFANSVTPPIPPKLLKPRRTSGDWTVDCFIARFGMFEAIFNGGYERWPNPIAWLEAEIALEEIRGQKPRPWKLGLKKGEMEPKDPPVIDWEILQRQKWATRGNYSQYPKPMKPNKSQSLELYDIISPNSFRFKESKRAKKDRKEKEKAAKRTVTVDLPGDSSGHMNQAAVPKPCDRRFDEIGSGYTGDESDLTSPMLLKRKYSGSGGSGFTNQLDSDDETFPDIEQLQQRIKQELKPVKASQDGLYGVSDREDELREQGKKKRVRRQPPQLNTFKAPPISDENLIVRPELKNNSFKGSSAGAAQKSGSRERRFIYTTSSPESDSGGFEVIDTSNRPVLPLNFESMSSIKSTPAPSSSNNLSQHNMEQRLHTLENQHRIPNSEFDSRCHHRLRSPTTSSPEPQQTLCPTIESSPLDNSNQASGIQTVTSRSRAVVDLSFRRWTDEIKVSVMEVKISRRLQWAICQMKQPMRNTRQPVEMQNALLMSLRTASDF